jgi:hypothetical protein
MSKHYGPEYEKQLKKQRDFERRVLEHLKAHRDKPPPHFDGLYVLFDLHRTGDVGNVLHELKQWGYIAVDKDQNVTITESGLKRLEDRDY